MLTSGEVFAGFTVERLLGQGGMGLVYLARHPRLSRLTALKLLNRDLFLDAEVRARFDREADLAAQLDHPSIVAVYDRGSEDGQLWISMQYVDGVDAAAVNPLALPPEKAVQIIEGVADALDYAHGMGVLHRDVKPANIMLARSSGGQGERVFLTDFGIARLREDSAHLTQTGMFTATLAYASPEQMTGAPLGNRSDQYSLACALYWLLAGVGPFDADNPADIIHGHLQLPLPSVRLRRPSLNPALDAVLAAGMAKRPEHRYRSCAEFASAARKALTAVGPPPLPVLPPPAYAPQPYPAPPGYPQPLPMHPARPMPPQPMPPQPIPPQPVPMQVPPPPIPPPHHPAAIPVPPNVPPGRPGVVQPPAMPVQQSPVPPHPGPIPVPPNASPPGSGQPPVAQPVPPNASPSGVGQPAAAEPLAAPSSQQPGLPHPAPVPPNAPSPGAGQPAAVQSSAAPAAQSQVPQPAPMPVPPSASPPGAGQRGVEPLAGPSSQPPVPPQPAPIPSPPKGPAPGPGQPAAVQSSPQLPAPLQSAPVTMPPNAPSPGSGQPAPAQPLAELVPPQPAPISVPPNASQSGSAQDFAAQRSADPMQQPLPQPPGQPQPAPVPLPPNVSQPSSGQPAAAQPLADWASQPPVPRQSAPMPLPPNASPPGVGQPAAAEPLAAPVPQPPVPPQSAPISVSPNAFEESILPSVPGASQPVEVATADSGGAPSMHGEAAVGAPEGASVRSGEVAGAQAGGAASGSDMPPEQEGMARGQESSTLGGHSEPPQPSSQDAAAPGQGDALSQSAAAGSSESPRPGAEAVGGEEKPSSASHRPEPAGASQVESEESGGAEGGAQRRDSAATPSPSLVGPPVVPPMPGAEAIGGEEKSWPAGGHLEAPGVSPMGSAQSGAVAGGAQRRGSAVAPSPGRAAPPPVVPPMPGPVNGASGPPPGYPPHGPNHPGVQPVPPRRGLAGVFGVLALGLVVVVALAVGAVVVLVSRSDSGQETAAAPATALPKAASPAPAPDPLAASRRAFPTLLPQEEGSIGEGYDEATCYAEKRGDRLNIDEEALTSSPWILAWECRRDVGNPFGMSYTVLEYQSAAAARSVVEKLPANAATPGRKSGVPFTQHLWIRADPPGPVPSYYYTARLVVGFPSETTHANYLVYASHRGPARNPQVPLPPAEDELAEWWTTAPL
ncbi:serine/threonine-protein kinase [Nocardia lijiangensis]|uniref:serine/threonine-protein kinase n=1 Tax=Nocardia lijiangensis TaxID=299618 RepID=UPI000ACC7E80|nr:serine/threonine-protein kinase [Nocardia lijiangensis]